MSGNNLRPNLTLPEWQVPNGPFLPSKHLCDADLTPSSSLDMR